MRELYMIKGTKAWCNMYNNVWPGSGILFEEMELCLLNQWDSLGDLCQ